MAELEPLSLSGMLFSAQQDALRDIIGDERYARALASLPPAMQETVHTNAAIGWIPFETVEAVVDAAAREADRATEVLQREVARAVLQRTLRGVWRLLVRFSSASATAARVPVLWGKSYNRGRVQVEIPQEGEGEIIVHGIPDASDFALRGFAFGTEALLAISRDRIARVQWRRTPDGAVYAFSSRRSSAPTPIARE